MGRRRELLDVQDALREATNYPEWRAAAELHDELTGAAAWRQDDSSRHYHSDLIRGELEELRSLRARNAVLEVVEVLHASLYRNLNDIANPALYDVALTGSKRLIEAYLDEAAGAIEWLATTDFPGIPDSEKLRQLKLAAKAFGQSALMLSGGATLGFYHLGVVKALFEHDLLPTVISGASTGAMIAAGVCARTDDELRAMYADTSSIRRDGLLRVSPTEALRTKALLDPAQLYEVLRNNVGDYTFEEAHRRSGRVLNISVSPTRVRQKPRLLCWLTSPDVLIASAALASSALPTLFPPVTLDQRKHGEVVSYIPTERWVDGSVSGDLPKRRLSRLHNANHFIVSQTNPHVLWLARQRGQRGLVPAVAGIATSTARTWWTYGADLARRAADVEGVQLLSDRAHALLSQDYAGDIDIHPTYPVRILRKAVTNPTADDLDWFILQGERAVWPRLAAIRDQTLIARTFARCVRYLEERTESSTGPRPLPSLTAAAGAG